MAIIIRLRRQGRHNRPFYRLVATNVRSPRDGKYVEELGWYNPFETELDKSLFVDTARVQHWLGVGAQLSDRVETLINKVAPSLVKGHTQKVVAHKAKMTAKKKARKNAA